MGGGSAHLEVLVLAPRVCGGAVAVRRGEAAARGAGDVRAPQGAGERVGDGEGKGVGFQDGQVGRDSVDGSGNGVGYGMFSSLFFCFSVFCSNWC